MASVIRTLALNFVARTQGLTKGIGRAKKDVMGFTGAVSSARRLLVGLGAGLGVFKAASAVRNTINELDRLGSESKTIGLTAQRLSALNFAAEQSNASAGSLQKTFKNLAATMVNPSKQAKAALAAIGVNFQKISRMGIDEQFVAIGEAIDKIKDPGTKLGIASLLFGKNAAEIVKLFSGGEFQRNFARGMQLSSNITPEAVRAADAFNDKLSELSRIFDNLITKIVGFNIDKLNRGVDMFASMLERAATFWGLVPAQGLPVATEFAKEMAGYRSKLNEAAKMIALSNHSLMVGAVNPETGETLSVAEIMKVRASWVKEATEAIDSMNRRLGQMRPKPPRQPVIEEDLSKRAITATANVRGPQGFLRGSAGAAEAQARFLNQTAVNPIVHEQQTTNRILRNIDRNTRPLGAGGID